MTSSTTTLSTTSPLTSTTYATRFTRRRRTPFSCKEIIHWKQLRNAAGWAEASALCARRKTNAQFAAVITRLQESPQCQRLPFVSFLLLPFQRITRIKMLIEVTNKDLDFILHYKNVPVKLVRSKPKQQMILRCFLLFSEMNLRNPFCCSVFPLELHFNMFFKNQTVELQLPTLKFR